MRQCNTTVQQIAEVAQDQQYSKLDFSDTNDTNENYNTDSGTLQVHYSSPEILHLSKKNHRPALL
eukprot:m.1649882 g.1649882  ORF g.1649882 m.1649882 type:complete len:65 (+) comp84353_c0_seq1:73-267(+)